MCCSFPGTLAFPDELVSEHLADCCHSSSSGRTFQTLNSSTWAFGKIKITKIKCLWLRSFWLFWIVPACEVSVSLFCVCSHCRVSLSDSSPSMLCSLTSIHWLTAYFYLFTTCEFAVVMSVVSGWRSRPRFIPVMCSPHSWAASVKPSTPPRRLWRRNMLDVSFTKTNRKSRFQTEVTCLVHSVGIHNTLYRV